MKCYVILVSFLSVFVFVSSAPFLTSSGGNSGTQLQLGSGGGSGSSGSGGGLGGLTNILSQIDLPGLLRGLNSFVKLIGVFCPPCSQILDNVIQNVTSTAFRVFGRAILQGGGLGGGRGGAGGGENSVNVVLPTFPPDEDDYDDDETEKPAEIANKAGVTSASAPLAESTTKKEAENAVFTSAASDASNLIAKRHTRITREAAADQALAESVPQPAEDLSEIEDEQDRNKRFLPFGGGSSSGGSGNFLFDIIRLVAGSGATEESDEKANSPDGVDGEGSQKSADHQYSEGIPGPITRLLVIANRGVANLIQDLILRLAQTSERLVNFKARLITSLI